MTEAMITTKPLQWRKPTDHPQDREGSLWIANGIGGRYSIEKESGEFILWWAHDEFIWEACASVAEAKAKAEADWQARFAAIAALSADTAPSQAEGAPQVEAGLETAARWHESKAEDHELAARTEGNDTRHAEWAKHHREDAAAIRALPLRPREQEGAEPVAQFLWSLLDDIDTISDMAKGDDHGYRELVEKIQRRRFEVGSTDGYTVTFNAQDMAVKWAAERWHAEVANRPLQNIHRSALDVTWRQVIRHFGGDPEALCGQDHRDLVDAAGASYAHPLPAASFQAGAEAMGRIRSALEEALCVIDPEDNVETFNRIQDTLRSLPIPASSEGR